VLYVSGTISQSSPALAIVGARAADAAALRTAHQLARHAGRAGAVVVSGGALGVDTAAHQGALDAGAATGRGAETGSTCSIGRNRALFAAVVASGGALVSIFYGRAAAPVSSSPATG
jgi:DNA processing protein